MQLGTKGRYAVMALLKMRDRLQQQHIVPLSYIAEAEQISVTYLEQLFTKLRKANIVSSVRGATGGYTLSRDAKLISLADVIMAVEENLFFTRCNPLSPKGCTKSGTLCKTHRLWEGLTHHVFSFLDNISLEDLASGNMPFVPDTDRFSRKEVANV